MADNGVPANPEFHNYTSSLFLYNAITSIKRIVRSSSLVSIRLGLLWRSPRWLILSLITFFCCDRIEFVVVHNGIITNYKDIKKFLVRTMCKYSCISIYLVVILVTEWWLFTGNQIEFCNLISALWNTQNSLSWMSSVRASSSASGVLSLSCLCKGTNRQ